MLEVVTHGQNAVYLVAFYILVIMTIVEVVTAIVGMSLFAAFGFIPEFEEVSVAPTDKGFLQNLFFLGQVPFSLFLLIYLASFSLTGTLFVYIYNQILNIYPSYFISLPITFVASIPLIRYGVSVLKKLLPKDDVSVMGEGRFLGKVVKITVGKASYNLPAQAKFTDKYNQTHYLMVAPYENGLSFTSKDRLIVIKKDGHIYRCKSF